MPTDARPCWWPHGGRRDRGTPGARLLVTALLTAAGLAGPTERPAAIPMGQAARGADVGGGSGVLLLDRSAGSGLDAVTWSGGPDKDHILESAGNGLAAVDYDGDSWPDLYLASAWRFDEAGHSEPHTSRLYRSRRDLSFDDVTAAAGVGTDEFASGLVAGDYDGDGWTDLYLTALGPDVLLRNNGDGSFSRVTRRAGIDGDAWSTGATFFDADGDGHQDLFVAAYIRTSVAEAQAAVRHRMWRGRVPVLDGPRGLPGDTNRFYRNLGDGTFVEATAEAGLDEAADRYAFDVLALDADGDGDQDLYVANDSQANALYENRGDGVFDNVGSRTGVGYNADGMEQGSMGVDAGDYDGDGLEDLLVTNFANDGYTLYRNLGDGLFLDVSFEAGIAVPTYTPLGWGALFLDVDLDGDLDIFFANGHLYRQVDDDPSLGESYRQRNQLMLNEGGRFTDVADAGGGLRVVESSRGAIRADLDRDGDLDLVVSNQDARPTLLENATPREGHWLRVQLIDPGGDRQALGARVTAVTEAGSHLRVIRAGGSYMSQSDRRVHFGLGPATEVRELRVRWPDGEETAYPGLDVDSGYQIVRGRPPLQERPPVPGPEGRP